MACSFDSDLLQALSSILRGSFTAFETLADAANRSNPPLSVLLLQPCAGVSVSESN